MLSILFDRVFVFFVILNLYNFARAGSADDLKDDNIDRGSRSDRGGLWFGPRLGKRSLRLTSDDKGQVQAFLRLLEAADAMKYYYDELPYYDSQADDPDMKVTKKVIFTPKLGRSLAKYDDKRFEDFTPRLGRRVSSQLSPEEAYRPEPEQVDNRIRYFSPRLGRNSVNFSPRLGRNIAYDHYPENVRVVRSTSSNKTDSYKTGNSR